MRTPERKLVTGHAMPWTRMSAGASAVRCFAVRAVPQARAPARMSQNGYTFSQAQPYDATVAQPVPESLRSGLDDPCSGAEIVLPENILPILQTAPFIRLKGLKQLGVCSYVFQTAEHTRYQHCVGVAWLSLQLVEHLSNASYLREFGVAAAEASHDELCQVVLAGLAHDLGHGPFSHLWERCMHRSGHADWCHEDMSLKLLDMAVAEAISSHKLPKTHFLARRANIEAAKAMIKGCEAGVPPMKTWLYTIVNDDRSGFDTDKLDYLVRDQHHIYHRDSYKRVINPTAIRDKARVVLDRSGTTRVAYRMDAKTQRMVNDVFEARAAMHEHVYQHGPVLACESMVFKLFDELDPVFRWSDKSCAAATFLHLRDNVLDRLDMEAGELARLPQEHQRRVRRGGELRHQLQAGRGSRWLFKRGIAGAGGPVDRATLEKQVQHEVCAELASEFSPEPNVWCVIVVVNEGKKTDKAVDKVPFYSYDGARGRIVARTWSTEEFNRYYGSHTEVTSAERWFANFIYTKAHEDRELEHKLIARGQQLFTAWAAARDGGRGAKRQRADDIHVTTPPEQAAAAVDTTEDSSLKEEERGEAHVSQEALEGLDGA